MRYIILTVVLLFVSTTNLSYANEPLAATQQDRELAMELAILVQDRLPNQKHLDRFMSIIESKIPSVVNKRVAMILDIVLQNISLDRQRVWDLGDDSITIKSVRLAFDGNIEHEICKKLTYGENNQYEEDLCNIVSQGKNHRSLDDFWQEMSDERVNTAEQYSDYECNSRDECFMRTKCSKTGEPVCLYTVVEFGSYAGFLPREHQLQIKDKAISISAGVYPIDDEKTQAYDAVNFLVERR